MAPIRPRTVHSARTVPAAKKRRVVMTLGEKIKVLDELSRGVSVAEVGRRYHCNESTIRGIRNASDQIRESVRTTTSVSAKVACVSRRDPILEKMEIAVSQWMESQNRKKCDVNYGAVKAKALKVYATISKREQEKRLADGAGPSAGNTEDHGATSTGTRTGASTNPFQASKGWFDNFKKRQNLHAVSRHGESGSADVEAASKFKEEFAKFILEEGYRPEQVFNADETGLFYKKVGRKTYVSKEIKKLPGYKINKDRVTIMVAGCATGDYKCKPMMIHRSQNPRALKGKNKAVLPVFWRANKKAWMTAKLFEDWFHQCFVPEVEKFLERKNVSFKALLLLDNAPGHCARTLSLDHPNVKTMFLPPNTTSILQPMDQGVIKSFKAHYTRIVYSRAIDVLDTSDGMTMLDFWKAYNIRDCIEVVKEAWDSVTTPTLNACWNHLWPKVVNNFHGFPTIRNEARTIVTLAHRIGGEGFTDMTVDDVEELIDSHDQELTEEELVAMVEEEMLGGDPDPDDEDDEEVAEGQSRTASLTTTHLRSLFQQVDTLCTQVMEQDPLLDRAIKFKRGQEMLLAPYKEVYRLLLMNASQTSITGFFRPISATPTASTSSATAPPHGSPSTSHSSLPATPHGSPVSSPLPHSPLPNPEDFIEVEDSEAVENQEVDVDDPLSL